MNTAFLKYPKKSHRKIINFPNESIELAELLGAIAGDGGITNWQLVISLNSISDQRYSVYLHSLIKNLFNIDAAVRKRPDQSTLLLVSSSTTLVDYLVKKGATRGNKIIQNLDIPSWIKGKPQLEKAFVRGLMDTDGCLYIHKHKVLGKEYKNIGLCYTSYSEKLLNSVAGIFNKFGIPPHLTDRNRRIYLYSSLSVVKYLNVFHSSNPRITNIFDTWRDVRVD